MHRVADPDDLVDESATQLDFNVVTGHLIEATGLTAGGAAPSELRHLQELGDRCSPLAVRAAGPAVGLLDGLDEFALGHCGHAADLEAPGDCGQVFLARVGFDTLCGLAVGVRTALGLGVRRPPRATFLRLPVIADLLVRVPTSACPFRWLMPRILWPKHRCTHHLHQARGADEPHRVGLQGSVQPPLDGHFCRVAENSRFAIFPPGRVPSWSRRKGRRRRHAVRMAWDLS